jgi:hypothetical protein
VAGAAAAGPTGSAEDDDLLGPRLITPLRAINVRPGAPALGPLHRGVLVKETRAAAAAAAQQLEQQQQQQAQQLQRDSRPAAGVAPRGAPACTTHYVGPLAHGVRQRQAQQQQQHQLMHASAPAGARGGSDGGRRPTIEYGSQTQLYPQQQQRADMGPLLLPGQAEARRSSRGGAGAAGPSATPPPPPPP